VGEKPSPEQGAAPLPETPITEMTTDEMIEEVKHSMIKLGGKAKDLGKRAYDKVNYKITSGELKEDAKKAATKVK
jgi:hypothetical protein